METLTRTRNVIFASLFALVTCCVILARVLHGIGVPLPDWTGVYSDRSALESRYYTPRPKLSAGALLDGTFQTETEAWTSDRVPMRDAALLGNAALQRTGIALAANVMGYDAYHTFYGSSIIHYTPSKVLLREPSQIQPTDAEAYQKASDALDGVAQKYPNIRFFMYNPPNSDYLDDSPAARLMTAPLTHSFMAEHLYASLDHVTVINAQVSYGEYLTGWHHTDHHWTVRGAYDGYARIADAMGFGDLVIPAGEVEYATYEQPVFYGSDARTGRCLDYDDRIMDFGPSFHIPAHQALINGEDWGDESLAHRTKYQHGEWSSNLLNNRYAEYFHGDYANMCITSYEARTDKTLLLVADSYSNNIERLFLSEYGTVLEYDVRYNFDTLSTYLDAHSEVDDVLILMSQPDFMNESMQKTLA